MYLTEDNFRKKTLFFLKNIITFDVIRVLIFELYLISLKSYRCDEKMAMGLKKLTLASMERGHRLFTFTLKFA